MWKFHRNSPFVYSKWYFVSSRPWWTYCSFLLDLSAAFDTIDHDLLLSILTEWFGIDGVVLQWVRSYLSGFSQLVKVYGVLSTPQLLLCGVPPGSVLGPLLFTMYTTPLSSITAFGLKHHLYADDTQIYTYFVADDITQSLIVVQNCMLVIQVWMNQNMLKLNSSKTEFHDHWKFNLTEKSCSYFPSWTSEPKFCRNRLHTKPGCGFWSIQEICLESL